MLSDEIRERVECLNELIHSKEGVEEIVELCLNAFKTKNKIFWIGNGGSAGDAQHLSAELVGRFVKERRGLASIALTTDTSALTCISNDYSYSEIFTRQLEALGLDGDVVIGLTTSGSSKNIILALKYAKKINMKTILLTSDRYEGTDNFDITLKVPSSTTAVIQEAHMFIGHTICKLIDEEF